MTGRFVTLEGPEGAGKSTQLARLGAWLEAAGERVVVTRNPGGTPIGRAIRAILLDPANTALVPTAELLLYAADRAQHVESVVRPALARGEWVLCDRFSDSTMAYQGYGRGLDHERLQQLDAAATGGLVPDLTILLDLDPEVGLARVAATRATDRLEHDATAFHHRLRAGYLAIAEAEPRRFVVIDASQSPDVVQQRLREALQAQYPPLSRHALQAPEAP